MLCDDVEGTFELRPRSYEGSAQPSPEERRIRWATAAFLCAFATLGLVLSARVALGGRAAQDLALVGLVVAVGAAAILHRRAIDARERRRRSDAESVARLVRVLARSASADAIVGAIATELAAVVEADHVIVARRQLDPPRLEATLVSTRPGIPSSTTTLPLADLEAPVLRVVAAGGDHRGDGQGPSAEGPAAAVAARIADRLRESYGLRNTLAAPLVVDGRIVGALILSRRAAAAWAPATRRVLDDAATEVSVALARVHSQRAAEARASTDALTGLPNRRYFDEFCGLIARRRRADDAVGVLMVDIDRFKRLNDSRGHAVGDEVIQAVAAAIASAVRDDDVPARYGGEEFAVLLRNPSREVAVEVGERVRRAVGALDLRRHAIPGVSVSVGVAVQDGPDQPITELIEAADQALYRAKRAGRDRVVAA
jgi:diguanylate cyclase (GGDEF)-like protein